MAERGAPHFPYNEYMIRSIVFPRVLGSSLDDLQPALELFRALGFEPGKEWHEGESHRLERLAHKGGIEFIAASDAPAVDVIIEVSDADASLRDCEEVNSHPVAKGWRRAWGTRSF